MGAESDFYRSHVGPGLRKHGHVLRVENSAALGVPDVSYAIRGTQGWVELKVAKGDDLYFEKFQVPYMRKVWPHCRGRGLWLLAMVGSSVKLWPADRLFTAPSRQVRQWRVFRVQDLGEPETWSWRPFDWETVASRLVEGPLG